MSISDDFGAWKKQKSQNDIPVQQEIPDQGTLDDRGFFSRAYADVKDTVSRWGIGAVQGGKEVLKQGEALNNIDPLAFAQETIPNIEKTSDQQQQADLYNKASNTFLDETVKPIVMPVALVSKVAGVAALPFMAYDIKHSYNAAANPSVGMGDLRNEEVNPGTAPKGGVIEGAKKVAWDFTFGGISDWANQPDFNKQMHDKPISTLGNGFMAIAAPLLLSKGAYEGMSRIREAKKVGVNTDGSPIIKPINTEGKTMEETLASIRDNQSVAFAEAGKDITPPVVKEVSPPKVEGNSIIAEGETQLGKPYQLGADGTNATDCGLFTQQTLAKNGVKLEYRTADGQYRQLETEGKVFTNQAEAQVGDLVFFDVPSNRDTWKPSNDPNAVNSNGEAYKGITHVGIYAGESKVLQAGSHGVSYADINAFGDIVGFGKVAEGGKGITSRALTSEESLIKSQKLAEDGDYTMARDEAIKSGNSDWADVYKKMEEQTVKEQASALDSVELALRETVDSVTEKATVPIGGSIKITDRTPTGESTAKVKFSDPEIEARWQEASKGVQKESLVSKIKEVAQSLWNKASRVYESMPNTAEFAPLKYDLLKLEKQKSVASDRTVRLMQGITAGFDKPALDLFTRKVILADLSKTKGDLPFGFTTESLSKEHSIVDEAIKTNQTIVKAIETRKKVWDALKVDYSKAMKDIGFNVENKISREDYFRHQVLEHANTRAVSGSGSKLKTPTNRGFLKERQGSAKDINANYLQAEFEVMAQIMHDTELAKTIARIDKNYSIRTKLFDEFGNEWRDHIPEGYTTWQPREGSSFYMANTIPEKLATQVLSGALEEVGVSADQIKQVLAKGSPFKELVVKEEVAATLNKISEPPSESTIGIISRSLVTPWKVWTLMSPTRAIKYNLRNVTGDADALFTMNPSSFKLVPQATGELFQTIYGDRAMTPEMGEWFKRGGMETTLAVQELQDIKGLRMFEKLADKTPNVIKDAWNGYWGKVKTATQFREAIFRYATYLDYLKQMEENGGKPKNFGASIPEEVMALSDIRDRAFELSNKVLGAYDNVGVLGKDIRTHIIPFWSWYETNFKRYAQFFDNQKVDSTLATAISRKLVGNVLIRSPYYAYATGSFVVKAGMLWGALQAYNNLVWANEEKELPVDEQARPHIILGRDESGKVKYFSRLGALPDFLEWFGLDTPVKDVKDYLDGSRSMKEIVTDMGKSPLNKLAQGISPLMKTPAELATGKKLFPDIFNPRSIKDNSQYIADSFGVGNEFKAISKTDAVRELGVAPRPSKPYLNTDTGENLLYYKAEPGQSSYYSIQDRKREYLKDIGKGGDGDFSSPKTEVLRNYKIALRLKDEESAGYYLTEFKKLGGTKEGLKKSLEAMNPLSGLNEQERIKFKKSLNGEQQEELNKAIEYYKTVLMGK